MFFLVHRQHADRLSIVRDDDGRPLHVVRACDQSLVNVEELEHLRMQDTSTHIQATDVADQGFLFDALGINDAEDLPCPLIATDSDHPDLPVIDDWSALVDSGH